MIRISIAGDVISITVAVDIRVLRAGLDVCPEI